MAEYSNKSSRLALRVQTGIDGEGNPVLGTLSWSNIDAGGTADEVDAVAAALEALLDVPVAEVQKADTDLVV